MRKNFPTRQFGFSMLPVFMIMIAMAGAAIIAMAHAERSLKQVAAARKAAVAKYAAEAGVAEAKAMMVSYWNDAVKWTNLLKNPPADLKRSFYYNYGGTGGIPMVKVRYRIWYRNNPGDPSGDPTVDQDGKVQIVSLGEYLDPSTSRARVLGRKIVVVEVYKDNLVNVSYGYTAQAHGGSNQASSTNFDVNSVSFSNVISF